MGEMRNPYKFLMENLTGREHSKDLDADGRLILEWILENRMGDYELD
jgi:hypothetical protein